MDGIILQRAENCLGFLLSELLCVNRMERSENPNRVTLPRFRSTGIQVSEPGCWCGFVHQTLNILPPLLLKTNFMLQTQGSV